MCQVQAGAYVSLLTPGETKYSDCHRRKTTTYILHVVSITTHTHDRRKSIGEKETKKRKEDKGKERKEKKKLYRPHPGSICYIPGIMQIVRVIISRCASIFVFFLFLVRNVVGSQPGSERGGRQGSVGIARRMSRRRTGVLPRCPQGGGGTIAWAGGDIVRCVRRKQVSVRGRIEKMPFGTLLEPAVFIFAQFH